MATNDYIEKDLGIVTAYGEAVAGGYTGSRVEFQQALVSLLNNGIKFKEKLFIERSTSIGEHNPDVFEWSFPHGLDFDKITGISEFLVMASETETSYEHSIPIVRVKLDENNIYVKAIRTRDEFLFARTIIRIKYFE